MEFVSRAAWGAQDPRKTPTPLVAREQRGIAVHYEARDSFGDAHDVCAERVRRVQAFHMGGERGWNDIAYSWLVCRHGTIFEGRGWGVRTAANGTDEGNDSYHAVCYLDDDQSGTDLTAPAGAAMGVVVRESMARGFGSDVRPHSSFKPTACPGDELRYWISGKGWEQTTPAKAPSSPAKAPAKPAPTQPLPAWYKRLLKDQRPMLRGHDVEHVQRRVRAAVDGIYGPDTASKVRGFQKLNGLVADGIVGPKTARKIG